MRDTERERRSKLQQAECFVCLQLYVFSIGPHNCSIKEKQLCDRCDESLFTGNENGEVERNDR